MTPLKGKGQRAQACPAVVINIKEPLVVVGGWLFASDVLVTSEALGATGVPGPPHTGPIDGLCPGHSLWIPASTKEAFVLEPVAPNCASLSGVSSDASV